MSKDCDQKNINKAWVEKWVEKWECRHNKWAKKGQYVKCENFSDLKKFLADKLMSDWKYGLAFFIDRTTYQSFGDDNAETVAFYLTKKILNLPKLSRGSLDAMFENIYLEKEKGERGEKGGFNTIRRSKDIERVKSICDFLIEFPNEENFTKIVHDNKYESKFLKQFKHVGDKTANFYLKFLLLILEVPDILPIVIDTHVRQSLVKCKLISKQEKRIAEIKNVITSEAERIGVLPIWLETALYEKNFRDGN